MMMKAPPSLRKGGFLAAMFLACFLLRLPLLLHPPSDYYYDLDEHDQTFAALDRFLGLPSTLLMKPASFLQFLFLPVFLLDMVIRGGLPLTPPAFLSQLSSQLSQACADPRHSVLLMRYLVALLCSAGPVLAYCLTDMLSGSKVAASLGAALVLLTPSFLQYSVMAVGDSVAVTLALASLVCLLKTPAGGRFEYAGFVLAAGLASRITLASFAAVPIIFLLMDERFGTWGARAKSILVFCTGLLGGFLFWCPYVWIDPIRMAKAVHGNVNKSGSHLDLKAFTEVWWQGLGAGFSIAWLVLFVAGCLIVFRRRQAMGVATVAGSMLICLPLVVRASTAFPRYFLPLLPCLVLLLAVVASEGRGLSTSRRRIRNSLYVLLILVASLEVTENVSRESALRGPSELAAAMKVRHMFPSGTVVYVPEQLLRNLYFNIPRAACERVRARLDTMLRDRTGVVRFAESRGVPRQAAEVLATDFNEREQSEAAHLAIACRIAPQDSLSVYFYNQPQDYALERSQADLSLEGAIKQVQSSKNSAILVEGPQELLGAPFWSDNGEWYWYKSPETHP